MLIESYLNRLTLSSYRPNTVDLRRRVLTNFEHSLTPRGLGDATRHDCEAFLARPLAPGSRRVYRTTLRHFYAWAVEEGLLTTNPAERIPAIRVKAGVPRPVSEADLAHALAMADQRMKCWLLLMSLAGLRCMEVSGLRPDDLVHTEGGWLLMLRECKGGASGSMPAHPRLVEVLLALPVYGGVWWTVTPVTVSRQVGAHLRDCGIAATSHQLRHTAATSWYRVSGEDLLATKRLLRHRSVSSTEIYAQLASERPAQVVSMVNAAG